MEFMLSITIALVGFSHYASSTVLPSLQHLAITTDYRTTVEPRGKTEIVGGCEGYNFPKVICVNNYGSVINGGFERNALGAAADTYASTLIPDDPSFGSVKEASFVLFDSERGREILGTSPAVDFMFQVTADVHEGPVYVPDTNELYFSRVAPGYFPQLVVNLSATPPAISERLADPPIYGPTGGKYHEGEIIYATVGGNTSLNGRSFQPGLYALDPKTGKSRTLLNNYYGYYFSSVDDIDIDSAGQIWFTNNNYGHSDKMNAQPPQLHTSTFRFDPTTGSTSLVECSLSQPNGIAFSPTGKTLYITDTGAGTVTSSPFIQNPQIGWNATLPRVIYAFDLDPTGKYLLNKRPIYQAIEWAPDGIKVSERGDYLVTATGRGVDVLTAEGGLVARVQVNFTVANLAWVSGGEVWLVGSSGVARVRWDLKGA